ncbi:MAG TPA: hypothetical protein DCQ64_07165 [Candidatus Rokubacteria bacterium]|nr:hypothetical protein [Candidatus Rokubacteria bacterium]
MKTNGDNRQIDHALAATGGQAPKVIGQIVISLLEVGPGQTATKVDHSFHDELLCRGVFDKARAALDQVWARPAAAPEARIVEGSPSLFQGLKRLRPS